MSERVAVQFIVSALAQSSARRAFVAVEDIEPPALGDVARVERGYI